MTCQHTCPCTSDMECPHYYCGCGDDDYDPTDAELEAMWTGPGSHPAHNVAWALHVDLRS